MGASGSHAHDAKSLIFKECIVKMGYNSHEKDTQ